MAGRTNLGPLTTPFSYPSHCTVAVSQCSTCDVFWQAQTCSDNSFNAQGVQDDPQCWPARQNPYVPTGVALDGWGFYSPGISCPSGYATSCVATGSVDGGFPFQFPLLDSETAVGCCPTGFHCVYTPGGNNAQTCYSIATIGSFAAVGCSSGMSNDYRYYNVPATVTETVGSSSTALIATVISTVTIFAPLFQLHYQSTDLSSSQISSTTQTASSTLASTSTMPASPNPPSSSPSAAAGLSSGAKAGIGVGAGVGGLLLLGAAIFFFFRRRKSSNHVSELMAAQPPPPFTQQHTQPAELSSYTYRSELPQYK
ncbi:hypothetical protein GGR51DRAFT_557492 [Nemania sp. FL0031]|nr:hypothetical protein GGR51DRAFT_557492 [Nemania sp. FL0031]